MNFKQKIKSWFFSSEETLNYDCVNQEAKSLFLSDENFNGLRSEFSKKISNWSFSSNTFLSEKSFFQVGTSYAMDGFMLQAIVDQDKSWQCKLAAGSKGFVSRIQTICSKKNIFSQLELNKSSKKMNIGTKIVSPAIQNIKPIYVTNILHKIGKNYFGLEAVLPTTKGLEVGIGMCFRKEAENSVTVVGLQQFTAFNLSYFKILSPIFTGAINFNYSMLSKDLYLGAALKAQARNVIARTQLDTSGKFLSTIESKITSNLSICISSEADILCKKNNLGLSFNLSM